MRQPDRDDFKAAMHKEVKHMFNNQEWEKVSRTEMLEYYRNIQSKELI
jgi:hypothetical protein